MIVRRRLAILAAGVTVATVSCATGSDTSTADDAAEAPAPTGAAAEIADTTVAAPADTGTDEATADEIPSDSAAADVSTTEGEAEPEEAPSADSTDDGSGDAAIEDEPDSPPALAEPGGRSFAESVEPASRFDTNPFPDLVVDDVGRETRANLANILPSDRPILLWTWAPH